MGRRQEGVPRQRRPRLDLAPGRRLSLPEHGVAPRAGAQDQAASEPCLQRLDHPAAARATQEGHAVIKKKRKTEPSLSAVVRDLRDQLADARWQLGCAKEKIREQGAQDEIDYAALDRCADAVTANERALFEASPAYRRYQEW